MKQKNKTLHHSLGSRVKIEVPLPGIRAAFARTGVTDAITLVGSFRAGYDLSPENQLIPGVVAAMLDEGTKEHSKEEIQEALDRSGGEISFSADMRRFRFGIKVLRSKIDTVLTILAEELLFPSFSTERLNAVKEGIRAELKLEGENTRVQAIQVFLRTIYPKGHPHYPLSTEEKMSLLEKITVKDLVRFHTAYFRGAIFIAAAGDVDVKTVSASLRSHFAVWKEKEGDTSCMEIAHPVSLMGKTVKKEIPSKSSVDIVVGRSTDLTKEHQDFLPLLLATRILGNRGFTGRLMKIVREKLGLTYGIYTYLDGFTREDSGYLFTWGTFAPKLLEQGLSATNGEIQKFYTKGATEKELNLHKTTLLGSYGISLSTSRGFAGALLSLLEEGKEPTYLDEYMERIRQVKLSEVNRVTKTYFDPKKNTTALAGTFLKKS